MWGGQGGNPSLVLLTPYIPTSRLSASLLQTCLPLKGVKTEGNGVLRDFVCF